MKGTHSIGKGDVDKIKVQTHVISKSCKMSNIRWHIHIMAKVTYGALQMGKRVKGEFACYGKYLGAEWSNGAAWIQTCNIYVACNGRLWNSTPDDMDTLHAAQIFDGRFDLRQNVLSVYKWSKAIVEAWGGVWLLEEIYLCIFNGPKSCMARRNYVLCGAILI